VSICGLREAERLNCGPSSTNGSVSSSVYIAEFRWRNLHNAVVGELSHQKGASYEMLFVLVNYWEQSEEAKHRLVSLKGEINGAKCKRKA